MKIIDIPRDLTSYEFFSNVLPMLVNTDDIDIVLDLSNTKRIEPLVVPNLLCLAYKEKLKRKRT